MSDTTLTIGDITIPIQVKEIDSSLGGSRVFLEESNKIYVDSGVSLNNEGVLKLDYEPVTDTIDLGWVRKSKQDAYHNEIESEIIPVKIARWTKQDVEGVDALLDKHISDNIAHISQEENITLSLANGLFELISIKYGEPEVIALEFNTNSNRAPRKFRHFCIDVEEDFTFNMFRLQKPTSVQNLEFPVFLKVFISTGLHNEEEGDLLGVSSNSVDIISNQDSTGYFEWSFSQTIEVKAGQYIMLTFLRDPKILKEHNPIFITAPTGLVPENPMCCIRLEDTETIIPPESEEGDGDGEGESESEEEVLIVENENGETLIGEEDNEVVEGEEDTEGDVSEGETEDGPTIIYTPNYLISYAPISSFVLQDANYIYFK